MKNYCQCGKQATREWVAFHAAIRYEAFLCDNCQEEWKNRVSSEIKLVDLEHFDFKPVPLVVTKAKQIIDDIKSMSKEELKERHRRSLNCQIALQMGWTHEADYHEDFEEWDGWRDPNGAIGIVEPPDFLLFLEHMFPALETYLAAGESDE